MGFTRSQQSRTRSVVMRSEFQITKGDSLGAVEFAMRRRSKRRCLDTLYLLCRV